MGAPLLAALTSRARRLTARFARQRAHAPVHRLRWNTPSKETYVTCGASPDASSGVSKSPTWYFQSGMTNASTPMGRSSNDAGYRRVRTDVAEPSGPNLLQTPLHELLQRHLPLVLTPVPAYRNLPGVRF